MGQATMQLSSAILLTDGFVVTIEPGIYIIPELIDQWQAEKKHSDLINYATVNSFRKFGGIRVEKNFLITASGGSLLGKPLVKKAVEIESLKEFL